MRMNHGWLSAALLVGLPLLLGNKGCEAELHDADAEAVEEPEQDQRGGDASASTSPASPAAEDDAALPTQPNTRIDGGVAPQDPQQDASTPRRDGGATSGACGTRGGVTCAADEFCKYKAGTMCGAADQGGACVKRPEVCTLIYQPVCGCDGKTYGSDCAANGSGVSVASEGECKGGTGRPDAGGQPSGKMCGGFAGLTCDGKGEFCNYEIEAGGQGCDGIADGSGVCQTMPTACTREYMPVCGCDRRTYGNACDAHGKGVSILRKGACTDVDCKAIGGRPVDGIGPAPKCASGETDHGSIVYANGQIAIEGTICCVK